MKIEHIPLECPATAYMGFHFARSHDSSLCGTRIWSPTTANVPEKNSDLLRISAVAAVSPENDSTASIIIDVGALTVPHDTLKSRFVKCPEILILVHDEFEISSLLMQKHASHTPT